MITLCLSNQSQLFRSMLSTCKIKLLRYEFPIQDFNVYHEWKVELVQTTNCFFENQKKKKFSNKILHPLHTFYCTEIEDIWDH